MKRLLVVLPLLLLLAVPGFTDDVRQGWLAVRYDLDEATNLTFCRSEGQGASVFAPPIQVGPQADSASTAVTSSVASSGTFTSMGVGDVIYLTTGQVTYTRGILTYTDADTLVIDEALTATSANVSWRNNICDTGTDDGWVSTDGATRALLSFFLSQYTGDGNGIDVRVEGTIATPDGNWNPTQLWPTDKTVGGAATVQNFSTAGITTNIMVDIPESVTHIRVGMMHNTADDGTDTTTDAEQITIGLTLRTIR